MTLDAGNAVDLLTIGEAMVLVTPTGHGGIVVDAPAVLSAGGAESNVAIGAATLGLNSGWYSRVGDGALGALVTDSIATRGVDTSHVQEVTGFPTGLMVKNPSPQGSRVYYYRTGSAATTMTRADLSGLPRPRVVHVSGVLAAISPGCRDLIQALLDGALAPARVSFDVNYRPPLWASRDDAAQALHNLASAADIVFVGRDEAETLWGTRTVEQIRAHLPSVPHLVIKDADIEAVEYAGTELTRVPAHHVDVVEPVGAGDGFAAGWLTGWIRGHDAPARLRGGHDLAAAVLRSPSDQAPAPTRTPTAE